jgi:sec-independent protein translocase protein TatB
MFDIGWDEMAVIAVISLIVIGPKDLPHVLRQMGRWTRKAREMASEFQRGVDDMVRETELQDLKKQVAKATDPNLLRLEMEKTIDPTGELARGMVVPPLDLSTNTQATNTQATNTEAAGSQAAGGAGEERADQPAAPLAPPPRPPEP